MDIGRSERGTQHQVWRQCNPMHMLLLKVRKDSAKKACSGKTVQKRHAVETQCKKGMQWKHSAKKACSGNTVQKRHAVETQCKKGMQRKNSARKACSGNTVHARLA